MYVMKSPIPTVIASCINVGIAINTFFLTDVTVMNMFIIPQMQTIASDCCHVNPKLPQSVYVNKAFNPSPVLCAYGTFAYNPVIKVAITEDKIVAA